MEHKRNHMEVKRNCIEGTINCLELTRNCMELSINCRQRSINNLHPWMAYACNEASLGLGETGNIKSIMRWIVLTIIQNV
jgi:hypothetical protein